MKRGPASGDSAVLKAPSASATTAGLRRHAEARLQKQRRHPATFRKGADAERLLHELQVHQIELEMQNAELSRAHGEATANAEKLADLYDFAPLGYVTLDDAARIWELNLTAVRLLGKPRAQLVGTPFVNWVARRDWDALRRHLQTAFTAESEVTGEVDLCVGGGRVVPVQLCTVYRRPELGQKPHYRTALTDITELKHSEEEIRKLNAQLEERVAARTAEIGALLEQSRQMQEQLRHLSHLVLRAQEEERKRISRELHDQVAQTLICINLDLLALTREPTVKPGILKQRIAHTQRLVEDSVNSLHRFTRELRPPMLDDLGLIPALHAYMKDLARRTGLRVRFKAFAGVEQLNNADRAVLYRVAQAALTNVARHAKASRAEVRIQKCPGAVRLEIEDDGIGFSADTGSLAKQYKHLGLLGMKERVEMAGGAFSLQSAPRQGTTIRAEIPLDKGDKGGRPRRTS